MTSEHFLGSISYGSGDACWEFSGPRRSWHPNVRGHRLAVIDGEHWAAHRYTWTITYGPIPAGLYVCHKCDNPPCLRPSHLFLGTARDNILDCIRKGRHKPYRGKSY